MTAAQYGVWFYSFGFAYFLGGLRMAPWKCSHGTVNVGIPWPTALVTAFVWPVWLVPGIYALARNKKTK